VLQLKRVVKERARTHALRKIKSSVWLGQKITLSRDKKLLHFARQVAENRKENLQTSREKVVKQN
jgi:hypothetical protein